MARLLRLRRGARAFEGVAPDLDQHCQRIVRSAESFGLKPIKSAPEIEALIREGIARFPKDAELYLRPMFWAADGFVDVDPESTEFSVSVYEAPLPKPNGFSVTCSPFRRPSIEFAPTDAKAACHYPNSARAIREAKSRGFDNAVMLDALGNVAELATAISGSPRMARRIRRPEWHVPQRRHPAAHGDALKGCGREGA